MSRPATSRAPEIALRMTVGAHARQVRRMVTARGARLAICGLALGLTAAVAAARLLESLLFGMSAVGPATYLTMSTAVPSVAALASWVPARRASSVDPMQLLRTERP